MNESDISEESGKIIINKTSQKTTNELPVKKMDDPENDSLLRGKSKKEHIHPVVDVTKSHNDCFLSKDADFKKRI